MVSHLSQTSKFSPVSGGRLVADCHLHSTASDGLYSPSEVAQLLHEQGLQGGVLTDHDTMAGWQEFSESANSLGLKVIPGVEISSAWKGRGMHVLCYGVAPGHPGMDAFLEEQRRLRRIRAESILESLEKTRGVKLQRDFLQRNGVICRPHIAAQLVTEGHVETIQQAFDRFAPLREDEDSRIPWKPLRQVLALIQRCGGKAVIAHPGAMHHCAAYRQFQTQGLSGIECAHPSHDQHQERQLRIWARNLGLLTTGGSDSHGILNRDTGERIHTVGSHGLEANHWDLLCSTQRG